MTPSVEEERREAKGAALVRGFVVLLIEAVVLLRQGDKAAQTWGDYSCPHVSTGLRAPLVSWQGMVLGILRNSPLTRSPQALKTMKTRLLHGAGGQSQRGRTWLILHGH